MTPAAAAALSGCIVVADGGTTVVHQQAPATDAYAAALANPNRLGPLRREFKPPS